MDSKPRVLVLSRSAWDNTNNSGNTLSNLFKNWKKEDIANLYCRDELPDNQICTTYFKISESLLIQKLFGKIEVAGRRFDHKEISGISISNQNEISFEKRIYNFFKANRWYVFLWLREFLWYIVNWKSKDLDEFVKSFQPEIIFAPSYDSFYMYKLLFHLKTISNAKIVVFHADDLVTYRQKSYSPFFWINRVILRNFITKLIINADKNYCIIDEQAEVYKHIYKKEFDLLYKSENFSHLPIYHSSGEILKMVYAGNIIYGRLESLIEISKVLKILNDPKKIIELDIYTANEIKEKDRLTLKNSDSVNFKGKVSFQKIPQILENADILLHVESFQKKQMYLTALSFSTKLIDYFKMGKPLFALGWEESASIKYLKKNDIGITCTSFKNLEKDLRALLSNTSNFKTMGENIWFFGEKNHNQDKVLSEFENDLRSLIRKND